MIWILALILIAIFVIAVLKKQFSGSDEQLNSQQSDEFPYVKRGPLFTPAERSFLGVLKQSVGTDVEVFGKVRIADVLKTKCSDPSKRQIALNKISKKHFDYILCNASDLSVISVVELNDSSHNSEKTKKRDRFVEGACNAAELPLIQIKAQSSYNIQTIKNALMPAIPSLTIEDQLITKQDTVIEKPTILEDKTCPKCSSELVKKMANKGKNAGKEFWACSAFPKCRHTEKIV